MSTEISNQSLGDSTEAGWLNNLFAWIKAKWLPIVILAICFQLVVIGLMTFKASEPLIFGKTLLVRVVPIDPRDFFRGEYVSLTYDFSRPQPDNQFDEDQWQKNGTTIYATLVQEEDGKHWRTSRFSAERPTSGTYIRGKVTGYRWASFGIESYFVQEGEGLKFEEAITEGNVSAEIAVGPDGTAILKQLIIHSRRGEQAPLGN